MVKEEIKIKKRIKSSFPKNLLIIGSKKKIIWVSLQYNEPLQV
jgi:hypothetical protein